MKEKSNGNNSCNMACSQQCKYCSDLIDPYTKPGISCIGECGRKIHVQCLSQGRVPTALVSDVFFDLTCKECNGNTEEISRAKMSWFKVVVLTLYNLRERSSGISRRGYFHWKSDIVLFIDRNWDNLFKKHVKRKKNWIGTISGTLSHYNNVFFKSGTSELGESGWWKLIDMDPPEVLAAKNEKLVAERKKTDNSSKSITKLCNSPAPSESSLSVGEDSNFTLDVCKSQTLSSFQSYVPPTEILSDFLLVEDDLQDMDSLDIEEDTDFTHNNEMYEPSLSELMNNFKEEPTDMTNTFSFSDISLENFGNDIKSQDFKYNSGYSSESQSSEDVSSVKKRLSEISDEQTIDIKVENMDVIEEDKEGFEENEAIIPASLFTTTKQREWPWKIVDTTRRDVSHTPMSVPEELHLLKRMEKYKHRLHDAHPKIRRLYRKLCVRKWKRDNNLSILNVDGSENCLNVTRHQSRQKVSVLDWFTGDNIFACLEQRLQGYYEPTSIYSPYTNRVLKPFIRRDTESRPVWLQVMQELHAKTNKNGVKTLEPIASIDYSYIRPQHIPAINSLCHQFFWPGIDLTECLQYPDFTCVVLYKKLVVGFAVMVPDVGINEAYISFILTRPEWRNAKIGTFMLYHLIQTCMGKDITLHVSASNPALFLYEKFGFKINEFVNGFYDKYMPPNSRESRHALFLRLSR